MKIRIEITYRELLAWTDFLGMYVAPVPGGGTLEKMLTANLAGLYRQLLVRSVLAKGDVVLKVDVAGALAFLLLAGNADPEMDDVDRIAINRIVGIIDQKTK